MIDDLKGWMVRYDFYRPHRQLGRKTPYEAVCDWHKKERDRFLKEPSSLLAYRTGRSQKDLSRSTATEATTRCAGTRFRDGEEVAPRLAGQAHR